MNKERTVPSVNGILMLVIVVALTALGIYGVATGAKDEAGLPLIGSVVLLVVLGTVCFAGLGVGLSGLIRSAEGSSAVVNLIVLPMAFLTGAFGPTHHYPGFLRAIGDVLPLKYLVDLANAIYLHGRPFWAKPGAILVLVAWGVAGIAVAALKFRWEPRDS